MEITALEDDELDSFIDELWVPAQREMAEISDHTLADDIRSNGANYHRSRLSESESITYLARRENCLLGYVTAEVQTPPPIFQQMRECHINALFVRDEVRRQGVAVELLRAIEKWGYAQNCKRLDLNMDGENQAARTLYETEGYEIMRYNLKKQLPQDE